MSAARSSGAGSADPQACLRDLVALSTAGLWWLGKSPAVVACTMCEMLMSMLRADVVYTKVNLPDTGEPVIAVVGASPEEIEAALKRMGRRNGDDPGMLRRGDIQLRLISMPVGMEREGGRLMVGCRRASFPTEAERVVLRVAANQYLVALQQAALITRLQAAQRSAEEAGRSKTEFLARISHDLRTPLGSLSGYIDLLEMGLRGPLNDAQRGDLQRMRNTQQYLLHLIDQVLVFMKLGSGQFTYQVANIRLDALLESITELILPQMDSHHVHFEADAGNDPIVMRADLDKLKQVLLNLLSNALKYTDANGRIRVSHLVQGATLVIEVSDTGCGIPAEMVGRIFEPYVQIQTNRPRQGAGLGLAISRDLTRGMGGDLQVRSAVGVGSTFSVSVPLAPSAS